MIKIGTYTNVTDSDVEVLDLKGLEEFIKYVKKGKDERYKGYEYLLEGIQIDKQDKITYLDFSGMDGWKIISYWYDEFVMFLKDLALFVEGTVLLEFENTEESGWFEFSEGKCIIHTGITQWITESPESLVGKKIKDIPEKFQMRYLARKI